MSAKAQHRVFDRYIDALMSLSQGAPLQSSILEQIEAFGAQVAANPDFDRAMRDPRVSRIKKEAILIEIAAQMGLDTNLTRTLAILIRKGRETGLEVFSAMLAGRLKNDLGIVVANVTAANDLTAAQNKELSETLGHKVEIKTTIDPSILGGLIIQTGSWRMDDSVKGKLDRLTRRLTKAA